MNNFKLKLSAFILTMVFLVSCEKETIAPTLDLSSNYLSEEQLEAFKYDYALQKTEIIKIDKETYTVDNVTEFEYNLIVNAFQYYPVFIYNDDTKILEIHSEDINNEEFLEMGKLDRNRNRDTDIATDVQGKAAARKVWYGISLFEHKDYQGQKFQRIGTVNMDRYQNISVVENNVGSAFNDKMSSVKIYVEPYDSERCSVKASLFLYKDANLNGYLSYIGGQTEYGVKRRSSYSYISGGIKDMTSFDTQEAVFEIYWWTYYKTTTLNDQLTSYSFFLGRTL